jgi:hypothetical protein
MPGGHGTGCRRADVGEIAVVEQHGLHDSGLGVQQDHEAVEAGQAALGVVEETGADLDREAVQARHIGGLDVDLAVPLRDRHRQDRRHHYPARS